MFFNGSLLTPDEVAKLLKIKPHTLAVWRCNKRQSLVAIKIGRLVRYRRSDVLKFIREHSSDFSIESKDKGEMI